ncbi:hypothetical protein ACTFIU_002575 [Dictyostelium citrinum]
MTYLWPHNYSLEFYISFNLLALNSNSTTINTFSILENFNIKCAFVDTAIAVRTGIAAIIATTTKKKNPDSNIKVKSSDYTTATTITITNDSCHVLNYYGYLSTDKENIYDKTPEYMNVGVVDGKRVRLCNNTNEYIQPKFPEKYKYHDMMNIG